MILEAGDYFVVTRGERMHRIVTGTAAIPLPLAPYYDLSWSGTVLLAREVQANLVCAEVVGVSGRPLEHRPIGSCHVLDLSKIEVQTVGRRFAELMRPQPAPLTAVSLGLAAAPVPPAGERSYIQIGKDQVEPR